MDGFLRDLLEHVVWEDHGLTRDVDPFLSALPPATRAMARSHLDEIAAELREHDLAYQLAAAHRVGSALTDGEAGGVQGEHHGPLRPGHYPSGVRRRQTSGAEAKPDGDVRSFKVPRASCVSPCRCWW